MGHPAIPSIFGFKETPKHLSSGIWIPYDKAVNLALKFDIYEITKKLFLVDVHDFDKLPKANKRLYEEDANSDSDILDSPSKTKVDKKSKKICFPMAKQ